MPKHSLEAHSIMEKTKQNKTNKIKQKTQKQRNVFALNVEARAGNTASEQISCVVNLVHIAKY